jgi:hypothetical protein
VHLKRFSYTRWNRDKLDTQVQTQQQQQQPHASILPLLMLTCCEGCCGASNEPWCAGMYA